MSEFDEFRFVTKDGKATTRKPIQMPGTIQIALHKAIEELGTNLNLEMRKKTEKKKATKK